LKKENPKTKNAMVSVLMACFNEEKHVARAIESILNQEFTDFEFVIVDDCSTDGTVSIIKEYAKQDKRIKLSINDKNRGLAYSLNRQLKHIASKYVARMDADDVSYPQRLREQIAYLEEHVEIDALGSNADVINENGDIVGELRMLEHADDLFRQRYERSVFIHPSVCFRNSFFGEFGIYDESQIRAQDLDLWLRALNNGARFSNLSSKLIGYYQPSSTSYNSFQHAVKAKFRNMKDNNDLLSNGHRLLYDVVRYYALKIMGRR
jgi:glycosyltransferase EpsE